MSVLNRAMFQQTVNRQTGSPPSGEGIQPMLGLPPRENPMLGLPPRETDDSTVYDFGDYGGSYDLKEEGFQRVLRNYVHIDRDWET